MRYGFLSLPFAFVIHGQNADCNVQCLAQGVLITRQKTLSAEPSGSKTAIYEPNPALKISLTTGLSRKEIEKAGVTIRHAIAKIMTKRR